jgi:hypothetical protein
MKLHPEARTTQKLRSEIKASPLTQTALAKQCNVSRLTIRKWQNREEMTDKCWWWNCARPCCCHWMT